MFFLGFKKVFCLSFLFFCFSFLSFLSFSFSQEPIELTYEEERSLTKEELENLQKELIERSLDLGTGVNSLLRAKQAQSCDTEDANCPEILSPRIYRAPAEPIPPTPYPNEPDYEYKDEDILKSES